MLGTLLLNITRLYSICPRVVVRNCLGDTKAMIVGLQAETADVIATIADIRTLTSTV